MPVPNYDNTLLGQYIRAIENPDSIGFIDGKWYQSPRKKDDPNNRGIGVDIVHNKAAAKVVKGRKGKWLTEKEERDLRNAHIKEVRRIQDEHYYPYLRKHDLSEAKKIMGAGLLYRGDGINENKVLSNAYYNGTDKDFQDAVENYYKSKGLAERAKNSNVFMNSHNVDENLDIDYFKPSIQLKPVYKEGGSLDKPKQWNDLSLREMSDVMSVAVRHGITSLQDIRDKWNEFAEGGYMPSKAVQDRIALWEGDSMKTNRSFEAEAKDFNRVIPESIRKNLSQEQLDALYSYGYNVGMGNLKKRVLPTLTNYVNGRAGAEDVASSMWASRDKDLRGLQRRRAYERSQFVHGSPSDRWQSVVTSALNMDLSSLPSGSDTPMVLPPNPTDYGIPVDYSPLIRRNDAEATDGIDPIDRAYANGMGIFNLMRGFGGFGKTEQEPLASYTPKKKSSSFVVEAPVYNDTLLDDSWFAKGGALYRKPNFFAIGGPEGVTRTVGSEGNETTYHIAPEDYTDFLNHNYTVLLPEVEVKAANPANYRSSYDPNGFMDFMNIATLGLGNRLSASQDLGIIRDVVSGMPLMDIANRAVLGNNEVFDNPYANLGLDIAIPIGFASTPKAAGIAKNAVDNFERRGIETFMRTTPVYNPIPYAKDGIVSMLQGNNGGKRRLAHIGEYLFTGHSTGPKGYYNSFAPFTPYNEADLVSNPTIGQRWNSFIHPIGSSRAYSGFMTGGGTTIPEMLERNDLIDAHLYNKTIDPSFGLKKVAVGKDFGEHSDYITRRYPKKANDIPVYETDMDYGYPNSSVQPSEIWNSTENGMFETGKGGNYVNAAGHRYTTGLSSEGEPLVKQQDLWKFNEDYLTKWLENERVRSGKKPFSPFEKVVFKFGLHEMDRLGTPIITRTKWIPQSRAIMDIK